ncbi:MULTISPECIES: DUF2382 domain-containing protein [Cyanophyceae]|uniref:DUF2382 domain-containing protein n=1 Tax=Cyanophyceae TaxID=3028117 RepID=UPI001688031A|nr:DUF2382 domain-containing protein [Trichocoleus sp. FACHB-40]MBD2002288.1 DUF2382 domain-containing protein [Trichocoleus sp. FACHB-40]
MNNETLPKNQGSEENDIRINVLLSKLKNKLKNYTAKDRQGLLLGEVKDVILDPTRQLNLVIFPAKAEPVSSLFLIRSKHIQQVDSADKTLYVDVSQSEIEYSADYIIPNGDGELAEIPQTSVMPTRSSTESSTASVTPTAIQLNNNQKQSEKLMSDSNTSDAEVVEQEIIRLLEERLVVDSSKHKVGEVIVRKEIQTRMVEIPVRREILIVEQVSPEHKQLAEIDLGQEDISGVELTETIRLNNGAASPNSQPTVRGEFDSPKTASRILDAIAHQRPHGCAKVRVEIILEDAKHQQTYQEWFDRCTIKPQGNSGK